MPVIDINSLESKVPSLVQSVRDAILEVTEFQGQLTVVLKPAHIRVAVRALKSAGYNMLMDLFAMDYLKHPKEAPERFAVIYSFHALATGQRVFLKTFLNEDAPETDSIHDIYQAANWFEREAWDLFGVKFKGHPHLERILCHEEFVGHPLRKDYPSDQYQRLRTALPADEI